MRERRCVCVCVSVCVCVLQEEVTESLKLSTTSTPPLINVSTNSPTNSHATQEEVTESLKLANIDKDGKIDYKEFAKVLLC